MKINHLPHFEVKLPVSHEVVKFRPFVMKEEKLLLLASESGDRESIYLAIDQAIKECSFNTVSCDTHSMVDVQYLFLQVRGKSVGEIIEFNVICGSCSKSIPHALNISDIQVTLNEKHTKIIQVDNNIVVTMNYPKMKHLSLLSNTNLEINDIYRMIAECIEKIQTTEEIYTTENSEITDFQEFIDNLTMQQFEKIKSFFDTMPRIVHDIKFQCVGCNSTNVVNIDEIVNFFG